MTSAPIMMLSWSLYSYKDIPIKYVRLHTAIVPLLFAMRFRIASHRDGFCTASSRSGKVSEARGGPFAYCFMMACVALFLGPTRKGSYAAVAGYMGDGMAEIVGSKFPNGPKWPTEKPKSLVGSASFALTCAIATNSFLKYANVSGLSKETMNPSQIAILSVLCSAAEILPLEDNYSVPITAATLATLL